MKHYLIHIEELNGDQKDQKTYIVNQYEKDKIEEIAESSKEEPRE